MSKISIDNFCKPCLFKKNNYIYIYNHYYTTFSTKNCEVKASSRLSDCTTVYMNITKDQRSKLIESVNGGNICTSWRHVSEQWARSATGHKTPWDGAKLMQSTFRKERVARRRHRKRGKGGTISADVSLSSIFALYRIPVSAPAREEQRHALRGHG